MVVLAMGKKNFDAFRMIAKLLTLSFLFIGFEAQAQGTAPIPSRDVSFEQEVEHAITRGLEYLAKTQDAGGHWSTPTQPAISALVLTAFQGAPKAGGHDEVVKRGYDFLLSCVNPDGSVHRTNHPTYNTSLAILALLAANKPAYEDEILAGRRYLIGLQRDFNAKGAVDSPFDGGVGYGSKYEHSDMGNTSHALEALYHSKRLVKDKGGKEPDLNWEAAIAFLQNCQNLPSHNKQAWVSDKAADQGGFVYYPGNSMAGGETNAVTGRVALRSYGSISYAGMMSYLYADLKQDDPRVQAVMTWLKSNYTLEENPGMGPQGLYYYYHTMSKALSAAGVNQFELANGKKVNWRRDLAMRVMNLQQKDGSWANEHARWMEKDAAMVTAYSLMTLERILNGMRAGE